MNNTLKKIWNVVSTVLVAVIVLCAIFLMGSRLIGYRPYTVLSGSMQPKYYVGDLIFVKQVYNKDLANIKDPVELEKAKEEKTKAVQALVADGTLKVGDPVTFVGDESLTVCTHRIVEIDEEHCKIYNKGDANNDIDAPVSYLNLLGEVHFSIPLLGQVSNYIQTPPGMYVAIAVGVILIAIVFLPDLFGKKKKDEEDTETASAQEEINAATEENQRLKEELEKLRAEMADRKSQ